MNFQSSRWVFHCRLHIGDGVVQISLLLRKQFIRRDSRPNANERPNVVFRASMFVDNIMICLVTWIVRPKAAIFEFDSFGALTTAFFNLYRREVIRGS